MPGEPYSQSKADDDRKNITVKYLESGYLTSSFRETVTSEKDDPHGLIVTYEIREGPQVTTSSVITLGRVHTKQRFIDRAAKFTLHAPLTTGDMLSAESQALRDGNLRLGRGSAAPADHHADPGGRAGKGSRGKAQYPYLWLRL